MLDNTSLLGLSFFTMREGGIQQNYTVDSAKLAEYERVYGRKLTSLEAAIIYSWEKKFSKHKSIYTYPDIPGKKLTKATSTYAELSQDELILGLQDSSDFGSGKKGVLFTTKRIYWKTAGLISGNIRYEDIDSDFIAFKFSFGSGKLILGEKHRLELAGANEELLKELSSFIQEAVALCPRELSEECWEFASLLRDGKPQSFRKYWSREEARKAIVSHAIATKDLFRKYNPRLVKTESDKGEWNPIPDSLYEELELSKVDIIKAEKKWYRSAFILLGSFAIAIIAALWFLVLQGQSPQSPAAWGRLMGGIIGVILGSIVMFRIHPALGITTLIGGLIYVMKSCGQ